jgi:hypothetical protein
MRWGFYSPLLGSLDPAVGERFLRPENRESVRARVTPAGLLPALED